MSRIKYPVPKEELERRRSAVRAAMAAEGIDCLVMHNYDRWFTGGLRYLTDLYYNDNPVAAVFTKDGELGIFGCGPEGGIAVPPEAAPDFTVNRCAPFLPVLSATDPFVPRMIEEMLSPMPHETIGLCHLSLLPTSLYLHLQKAFPKARLVDASHIVDEVQAVKSPWELELCRKTVEIHDTIMAEVPKLIRVGKTERQITNALRGIAMDLDCEDTNFLLGSHPSMPGLNQYLYQNNTIAPKDVFGCLVEVSGPGGFWGECERTFCLGSPSEELVRTAKDALELQDIMASACVPGAKPAALFDDLNTLLVERGYPRERRFFSHGQGYSIAMRPNLVPSETMELRENMFISIHPICVGQGAVMCFTDNFVVTPTGAQRLNKTPRELFVL